jgi:hypothetical protein
MQNGHLAKGGARVGGSRGVGELRREALSVGERDRNDIDIDVGKLGRCHL